MRIYQGEFATVALPDDTHLETAGLGPCIGVAIISNGRGFLLHADDPFDRATNDMFAALEKFIPAAKRAQIRPLLAGGVIEPLFGNSEDDDIRNMTLDHREEIKRRLREAGFGKPRYMWAEPLHTQAINLDLSGGFAELEADHRRSDAKRTRQIPF